MRLTNKGLLYFFQFLCLVVGNQTIYDLIKIPFENLFESMECKADPVVSDPVLGEIICPYSLAPVSGTYL